LVQRIEFDVHTYPFDDKDASQQKRKEYLSMTILRNALKEFGKILPDKLYLNILHYYFLGEKLNFKNPVTFNEKLNWLKLYHRKQEYTQMVDKYEVRELVSKNIGEKYLIPLIGIFDKVEDIKWNDLPDQFVLKGTHDSGSVIICEDKKNLDIAAVEKKLRISLKKNQYWYGREWPYKNVRPRIICEELIQKDIKDYKFYCFNGLPQCLYVSQGLTSNHTLKVNFFDMEWNKSSFSRTDYPPFEDDIPKPEFLQEMRELCCLLAKDIPFIRVDLYEVDKKIYFSELTFSPCAGFMPFSPKKYDEILGGLIELPPKVN